MTVLWSGCFLLLILGEISGLEESLEPAPHGSRVVRIVGGKRAKEAKFPYVAALYMDDEFLCTASIITTRTILTAAHCVVFDGVSSRASRFYAVIGSADRSSSDAVRVFFRLVTPHPDYDGEKNDIAIMETTDPIAFNKKTEPICIARPNKGSLIFKSVIAMGWGATMREKNPESPDTLHYVDQRVVSNLKCTILFHGNHVPDTVLCANGILSGVCYGDSGGPLVLPGFRPVQVGVASYINGFTGCGRYFGPAGYTRISSYVEFITSNALGEVCIA